MQGFTSIEESDLYLYPDLDTFETFPWRPQQGKVARIICDIYRADGTPFEGDPRYVLKKVVEEAEQMGYTFDVAPLDSGENVRREIILTLEEMGFEIESSHHEDAPSQHEIDFKYADALKTADNIMTLKIAVRTIAKRHGYHATFMPKPFQGMKGSGMHVNMSLSRNGENIFDNPAGTFGLSEDAYHFMAGIFAHIKGMTVITNPIVNSYKRLVSGYEAPVDIAWSAVNRSPLIRIPVSRGSEARIELRSPDSAANPYLVIAVCLAAGLDGMKKKLTPLASVAGNIFNMTEEEKRIQGIEQLPSNLYEAIKEFEEDEYIKGVIGNHIAKKYISAKKSEWKEYCTQVSDWEREQYLGRL